MYRPNPFTQQLDYKDVPKGELREFFARFKDALAERTRILTDIVHADSAFNSWTPDLTPESLEILGAWFAQAVQTRPQTEAEIFAVGSRSNFRFHVPSNTLTDHTFSLAADVGMYFARTMIRRHPHLRWNLPLGSKNNVDYGQPVLEGFRRIMLNPVSVATTVAWAQSRGRGNPSELRRLFDVWGGFIETPPAVANSETE